MIGSPMHDRAQGMPAIDVLRWPVAGRFLRWRHARTSLQLIGLAIAAVILLDGFFGPQVAPTNMATVLTWVHYRGLLVVALLAAGNFFCTACPFVLVRDAARRGRPPSRRWPRWLRTKWIGLALFAGVLFAYELFDLWALPRATAWLVLGYFGAALAVDLAFSGASFCKYLCPVGQFNFAASTLSPLEVQARDRGVCLTCRTSDCIKGRRLPEAPAVVVRRGCELGLFLPAKVGNLDCTFCLDCVKACPHDNVAIALRPGGAELLDDRRRSGIGRLAARPDIAALAVVFTFGALLNAFAMSGPGYQVERWVGRALGVSSAWPVLAAIFVASLVAIPAALLTTAAAATSRLTGAAIGNTIVSYAAALLPLGFGMWIAHYMFHLLTGALTIVPVTQNAVLSLAGWPALGDPRWSWTGLRPGAVFPIQIGFLLLGTIGALALAHGISEREHPDRSAPATIPWALLILALASAAFWILWQPMDMRGTGFAG
jgi:polyferredoxin